MARPLRIQYKDAYYHVFSRGERKDDIFMGFEGYSKFVEKLEITIVKFNLKCYAFVLMPNHYHLFISTPEANLTKAMHYLNTSYSNWVKAKHQIVGHVFQGRYKSILIDNDSYLSSVIDYIHLNPVKAEFVKNPWDYAWSSCGDYVNKKAKFNFLLVNDYLFQFHDDLNKAKKQYKKHIRNSNQYELPHRELFKQTAMGGDDLKELVEKFINKRGFDSEISQTKMTKKRNFRFYLLKICSYFDVKQSEVLENSFNNIQKKFLIYFLKKYTRITNKQIATYYNLNPSTISSIYYSFSKKISKDKHLQGVLKKLTLHIGRSDPS